MALSAGHSRFDLETITRAAPALSMLASARSMRVRPSGRHKTSIGLLLWALALVAGVPSRALALEVEDTRPGLRLSAGVDVFRAPGSTVATGRYGGTWGAKLGVWAHSDSNVGREPPNVFIGVDYMLKIWNWRAGIGVAWIDKVNRMNGTRWNLDMTLAYDLSDRVFVEYRHQSHATVLGIRRGAPNGSWNIVGLGWYFGRAADAGK